MSNGMTPDQHKDTDPVAVCACGRGYHYTLPVSAWHTLAFVGVHHSQACSDGRADPDDPCLEVRNCTCGSTRAVPIKGACK